MNQFTKKKHFIGIDISKDQIDLALVNEETIGEFPDIKVDERMAAPKMLEFWKPIQYLTVLYLGRLHFYLTGIVSLHILKISDPASRKAPLAYKCDWSL